MNHLHYVFDFGPDDIVKVRLDTHANVLLLDDENYQKYLEGLSYRYRGGWAQTSPVHLKPAAPGRWHVVIDRGGYSGTVRARVEFEPAAVERR